MLLVHGDIESWIMLEIVELFLCNQNFSKILSATFQATLLSFRQYSFSIESVVYCNKIPKEQMKKCLNICCSSYDEYC